MIAAMSLFAAMTRASSGRSSTRGTTSAARIPRITMTTSTSISVKPEGIAGGDPGRVACADYNPPVRARSARAVPASDRSPPCPERFAPLSAFVPRPHRRGRGDGGARAGGCSQPLPLPASPFAFDVKAGASLKSVARDLAGAGVLPHELPLVALARLAAGRPVDQGGELRNRRGHHAAAPPRQADAGRRHAGRADGRRGQHVRRARRGARLRIPRS